ncbi:hypothetical protein D3C72_1727080 [compost metagenome]
MAKPDMGDLDGRRHAVDQNDLVAPVELVSLTWRVIKRNIGFRRHCAAVLRPCAGVSPDSVIAALIAKRPDLLVNPDQRQPLA